MPRASAARVNFSASSSKCEAAERLDGGDLVADRFEVDAFVSLGAADAIGHGKSAQRAGQIGIGEGIENGLLEFLFHAATSRSSTRTTMSRSGPCTPMVSTRSMSAVRLGPVMKER